ncbi:helix-turn-helix transcriptional regulator [Pacificoceanicola onchidii]|uniref:helix-turn-helix transcriptional regulator n=1 Tax=Pacificoceanicola onchidii TaxID=2562685 RepID=UPI0010A5A81B|nr:YafY family protein [Pacificoceanicola onchidii]
MRRAERLFRMVNELRASGVTRASDLAERFEISLSTVYRDIAHLQASGLPIDGEAGVGYVLRPGFDLPNPTFTHDQLDALAVGLAFVERTGDPSLAAAAREARAKIQAGLPAPEERRLLDAPYYSLHRQDSSLEALSTVRKAIRERRVLGLSYRTNDAPAQERQINPLVVWDLPVGWMVAGWCRLRQDFRTFRNDRIVSLWETDAHFDNHPEQGLAAYMALEECHR